MKNNRTFYLIFIFFLIKFSYVSASIPGFYVSGRHLYSPCGEKVILRGVNEMATWCGTDPTGSIYLPEIAKTGANVVRLTFLNTDTSSKMDPIITNCINNKMIPMLENHSATGNWNNLQSVVDWWCNSDRVNLIKKHEKYLLINIANECGNVVTDEQFRTGYRNAVIQMRNAGINVPLIIDGTGWGQNIDILQANWQYLQNEDPLHNLMFSVHMWWTDNNSTRIINEIAQSVSIGMPLIVGEFAHAGVSCACCIAYQTIIQQCTLNEIGYLAWSWGAVGNGDCAAMSMTCDGRLATLGMGTTCGRGDNSWALTVVNNTSYGITATSVRPQYILNNFICGTPTETPTINLSATKTFTQTITRTHTITPTVPSYTLIYDGDTSGYRLSDGIVYNGGSGTMTEGVYGITGNGMRLTYVSIQSWWQEHRWEKTLNVNIGSNTHLVFNVRQAPTSPNAVNQLFVRINWTNRVMVDPIYIVEGGSIDTTWKTVRVPLSVLIESGQTGINFIGFAASWDRDYTVDIDNIYLEAITPTATNTQMATNTWTRTPTYSATSTPTYTYTFTSSRTSTSTCTGTPTLTNSITRTSTMTTTNTRTGTQTQTATFTVTRTNTPTSTASLTCTRTNTPATNTSTVTMTGTNTNTLTSTHTATSTGTNTNSPTHTYTFSATATLSASVSPSYTQTDTQTNTATATNSQTATFSYTVTMVSSQTPTDSYTGTETATKSVTVTETETTIIPSLTFTATRTQTETPTLTNSETYTMTFTFTYTATVTPSFTTTQTPTFTYTLTNMPTYTQTFTPTATYSLTLTSTMSSTQQPVLTPTSTQTTDNLESTIENVFIYPNPYNPEKGDLQIRFNIKRASKLIKVKIYTVSLRKIKEIEKEGQYDAGQREIYIEDRHLNKLSNGTYIVILTAKNTEGEMKSKLSALIIVK